MNYRDWLIDDLRKLDRCRFACSQLAEELETAEAEFTAIKATNYDKQPGGSGDNAQEEKMLTAIARKDELAANLAYNRRKVDDMERLLSILNAEEREVLERLYIRHEIGAAESLAEEFCCDIRTVYRIKNAALLHMAQARHGFSYQT